MRAVVLRDGWLDVREIADPVPGPGELLLRTLSTAICASDVHFMDHPEMGINDPTGRSLYDVNRDIVLGHEFVGEVVGHGPECTEQLAVGTRVEVAHCSPLINHLDICCAGLRARDGAQLRDDRGADFSSQTGFVDMG